MTDDEPENRIAELIERLRKDPSDSAAVDELNEIGAPVLPTLSHGPSDGTPDVRR